jgi:hypothetical protein
VYSARVKVPECIQNSEGAHIQIKGNHHKTNAKDKISYLLPDEWSRQWHVRGRRGAPG